MPIKMKDIEIIEIQSKIFKQLPDMTYIQLRPLFCYCASCSWADKGCNIQNTICRTVAENQPITLTRKDLNNLVYTPK